MLTTWVRILLQSRNAQLTGLYLSRNTANVFNIHGSVHRNNILMYIPNKVHMLQSLFYLTIALHVSGVTVTHIQEHKTTVTLYFECR